MYCTYDLNYFNFENLVLVAHPHFFKDKATNKNLIQNTISVSMKKKIHTEYTEYYWDDWEEKVDWELKEILWEEKRRGGIGAEKHGKGN